MTCHYPLPVQQNLDKMSLKVLSQLEEMRPEMALLEELKAEVSQIRESMPGVPKLFHAKAPKQH